MATIIPARRLYPGMVLVHDLFSRQGIRLLHAGARLDDGVCKALARSGEPHFVMARDGAEAKAVCEDDAPPGGQAKKAPTDAAAKPWTGPGSRAWGVRHGELSKVRAAMLREADGLMAERAGRLAQVARRAGTVGPVEISRGDSPGWLSAGDLAAMRAHTVGAIAQMQEGLCRGMPPEFGVLVEMVEETVALYARHPRRFAQLATCPARPGDEIAEQSYSTMALAVGLAARMGWSRADVRIAGLCGVLCDAGMRLIHADIRRAARALDDTELNRMRRHVTLSGLLTTEIAGLPEAVTLAVLQHHERDDSSGYPRGSSANEIHDAARVVAVADCFAAATAGRPHRPARSPATAMNELIAMGSIGVLDRRVMQALAEVCGLFPVGSFVRLSDDGLALVVGVDPAHCDRPIVQRYRGGQAGGTGESLDLASMPPWELSVIEAVDWPLAA